MPGGGERGLEEGNGFLRNFETARIVIEKSRVPTSLFFNTQTLHLTVM